MLETQNRAELAQCSAVAASGSIAIIWIDWYAYHLARFAGLCSAPGLAAQVNGIELVGGIGVHDGLKFREELPADLPVETLLPDSSWHEAGQLRLAILLWRHLSRLRPKLLLIPGYYTLPALNAALWCKLHRCTAVMMTESTADDHPRSALKERFKSLLIRILFDWAICGGGAHRRYLRVLGFPADRVADFYDVVDNDFFRRRAAAIQKQPRSSTLPADYFLYVGRLAPEKNVEMLLKSWLDYRTSGGTWSLVLVGDGSSMADLRSNAAASPFASDVHFAGLRTSTELPEFYALASCFVLPSSREPWGLVVNEAMASGLPVLVSSSCGCAENLIDAGRNGFTFSPSDQPHLSSLLWHIEAMDPVRRSEMGNCSRQLIQRYSPSAFGAEIIRIFNLARQTMGT